MHHQIERWWHHLSGVSKSGLRGTVDVDLRFAKFDWAKGPTKYAGETATDSTRHLIFNPVSGHV
jgi:hypothetical protein